MANQNNQGGGQRRDQQGGDRSSQGGRQQQQEDRQARWAMNAVRTSRPASSSVEGTAAVQQG